MRHICFTENNPVETLEELLVKLLSWGAVKYAAVGFEVGSQCDTPYFQEYLELRYPVLQSIVVMWFPPGTLCEFGTISRKGQQSDLEVVASLLVCDLELVHVGVSGGRRTQAGVLGFRIKIITVLSSRNFAGRFRTTF